MTVKGCSHTKVTLLLLPKIWDTWLLEWPMGVWHTCWKGPGSFIGNIFSLNNISMRWMSVPEMWRIIINKNALSKTTNSMNKRQRHWDTLNNKKTTTTTTTNKSMQTSCAFCHRLFTSLCRPSNYLYFRFKFSGPGAFFSWCHPWYAPSPWKGQDRLHGGITTSAVANPPEFALEHSPFNRCEVTFHHHAIH